VAETAKVLRSRSIDIYEPKTDRPTIRITGATKVRTRVLCAMNVIIGLKAGWLGRCDRRLVVSVQSHELGSLELAINSM